MEIIEYEIQQYDTLASIAEKHNITIEELVDYHNQHCGITQQIIGNKVPVHVISLLIKKEKVTNEVLAEDITGDNSYARYRCEQTVLMKLNGVVHSHADTKREFLVTKNHDNNELIVEIELVENIVEAYKKELELAIKLISEIDIIKSSVKVNVSKSGKIDKLLNHSEILNKWRDKKNLLNSDFSFIRNNKTEEDFKNFIELNNQQFQNPEVLISELNNRFFFDIFFDRYLVADNYLDSYSKTYYSQLFDSYAVNLNFNQDILNESPNQVELRKVSSFPKSSLNNSFLVAQYDNKFKPIVKYKFSEYNYSVRERCIINTDERWIEQSDITIIEEVKNNVQVLIEYKLRKIE